MQTTTAGKLCGGLVAMYKLFTSDILYDSATLCLS